MGVLDKLLDAIKLNDDDDDYLEDDLMDDDFLDDDLEEKPKKNLFSRFSRRQSSAGTEDDLDEFDIDDEIEEEPVRKPSKVKSSARKESKPERESSYSTSSTPAYEKPARQSSPKITPMRSSRRGKGENMEVTVIRPTSMENTREIADSLIAYSTVILNLEGIDVELAQRIIDFTSGSCYSLGGTLQKISSYIFVLGPSNVDITGDLQNILGGNAPFVRAGY